MYHPPSRRTHCPPASAEVLLETQSGSVTKFFPSYVGAPGLPDTALLAGCKILFLLGFPLAWHGDDTSFCPVLSFSRSWKSHSSMGQLVWDGEHSWSKVIHQPEGSLYHPPMEEAHALFQLGFSTSTGGLLFFNWALLPAARTNNHFSSSDTVLYIPLQPLPKHQSHATYHKPENSLNLAYLESSRAVPALRRTALAAALPLAQ